jgi:hypothetical protein
MWKLIIPTQPYMQISFNSPHSCYESIIELIAIKLNQPDRSPALTINPHDERLHACDFQSIPSDQGPSSIDRGCGCESIHLPTFLVTALRLPDLIPIRHAKNECFAKTWYVRELRRGTSNFPLSQTSDGSLLVALVRITHPPSRFQQMLT